MSKFNVDLDGPVLLAFSGGKDSSTLLSTLRILGVDVIPAIVDLGCDHFKNDVLMRSKTIQNHDIVVISARSAHTMRSLSADKLPNIQSNLELLRKGTLKNPCTICTQTTRILLCNKANQLGAKWVVFGHHREDIITTILKDYFAVRYFETKGKYEPATFADFVENEPLDFDHLRKLVSNGMATTMAIKLAMPHGINLVRPLALVAEKAIEEYIGTQKIETFAFGCWLGTHYRMRQPLTKREIIHTDLRRRLAASPQLGIDLLEIALSSLGENGEPVSNPRARRNEILPGFD